MGETPQQTAAYAWFDAEFTSLELERARLLQVALVLTDSQLRRITPPEEDVNLFIRLEPEEAVSPWVQENLPDLVEKCRSTDAVSLETADARLADLLDRWVKNPEKEMAGRPVLAGNSIHNDWFFVRRFLPAFSSRLHYRLLDVSALKIQWNDLQGEAAFDKESLETLNQFWPGGFSALQAHDALFDAKASIAELAFYRTHLFRDDVRA